MGVCLIASIQQYRIGCKGLSETPLYFIFQYNGDSVGRYRRYPLLQNERKGPLVFFNNNNGLSAE